MSLDPTRLTPDEFIQAAQNVRKTFYWEKKDLPTYVVLTKHLLATAVRNHESQGEYAGQFGERVMGLGYDLASMTWPGWDEAGIEITEELRKTGLEAARLIIEFADRTGAANEARFNACWMLGAHLLTDGDADGAKNAWEQALECRADGETRGIAAWILLADSVTSGERSVVAESLRELEASEEPLPGIAGQIRTVMDVLSRDG